jgi:hypothetical protein
LNTVSLAAHVWPFSLKQNRCSRIVSGCQRACAGPLGALVVFSVVKGSRRGIGTLPTLIT